VHIAVAAPSLVLAKLRRKVILRETSFTHRQNLSACVAITIQREMIVPTQPYNLRTYRAK
jgi:hypothetical protein